MKIDKLKTVVLGFFDAGWSDYIKKLSNENILVYTTTTRPLSKAESIYWASHSGAQLKIKAKNKRKDPQSVSAAVREVGNILLDIQSTDTRHALLHYIIKEVYKFDWDVDAILISIEQSDEPNLSMICFINQKLCKHADSVIQEPYPDIDLEGYTFARTLKDPLVLKKCLKGDDAQKLARLSEWTSYVNLSTKAIDVQESLAASKSLITDTLQYNLVAYSEKRPLLAIHFVVASESGYGHTLFKPNYQHVTHKVSFALTDAELRMAYKLVHEVDDPLIKEIMQETLSFYKKVGDNFVPIPAPWQINPEQWISRNRTDNKSCYEKRSPEQIPTWVKEMVKLSLKAQSLDAKTAVV